MKHAGWAAAAMLALTSCTAWSQGTSLDILEQDLNQITQDHQASSAQSLSSMMDQLSAAMASPDAAVDLYQKAGGIMPAAAPIQTEYEHETPTEKEKREAQDAAAAGDFATIIQLHCGLMRFGVLFATKPDTANLESDWEAWLKNAATLYGKLTPPPEPAPGTVPAPVHHHAIPGVPEVPKPTDMKAAMLKDSIFNPYFSFHNWGTGEQGMWTVKDLPKMFRKIIIEPAKAAHNPEVLADWDLYIGMRSANQSNPDTWAQIDLPWLQFERGSDDFDLAPSTDKLSALITLIKANSAHPQVDDMIKRAHEMLDALRAAKGGTATPAASTTTNAPVDNAPAHNI